MILYQRRPFVQIFTELISLNILLLLSIVLYACTSVPDPSARIDTLFSVIRDGDDALEPAYGDFLEASLIERDGYMIDIELIFADTIPTPGMNDICPCYKVWFDTDAITNTFTHVLL